MNPVVWMGIIASCIAAVAPGSDETQVVDARQSEAIGVVIVDARAADDPPVARVANQISTELRRLAPTTVITTVVGSESCGGTVSCALARALAESRPRESASRAWLLVALSSGTSGAQQLSMHWYAARLLHPLLDGLDPLSARSVEVDARIERDGLRLASSALHPLEPSVVGATIQAWRQTYPAVDVSLGLGRMGTLELELPRPGFDVGVGGTVFRTAGTKLTVEGLALGSAERIRIEHPEFEPLILDVLMTSTVVRLMPNMGPRKTEPANIVGIPAVLTSVVLGGVATVGFVVAQGRAENLAGYCTSSPCSGVGWPRVSPEFASTGSGPMALPLGYSAAAGAVATFGADLILRHLGYDEPWWVAPAVGLATGLVVYGTSELVAAAGGLSP